MMEGEVVTRISELAKEAIGQACIVATEEAEFSTRQLLNLPKPHKEDEPSTFALSSLDGLLSYVEGNRDELDLGELIVHVESPRSVAILSRLRGRAQRFEYVRATAMDAGDGIFNRQHPQDTMVVLLQTRFADTLDRAKVLQVVGNVANQAEIQEEDDGVTQTVTAKAGVIRRGEVTVANPVVLTPYRAFREIEQVPAPFVLRLSGGVDDEGKGQPVRFALHEAAPGEWELEAVRRIGEYLRQKLPSDVLVIL